MKGLTLKSFEEVRSILEQLSTLYPLKPMTVETTKAKGYVLLESVTAPNHVPAFNRSIVDGYAVGHEDCLGASKQSPIILEIDGEVVMGQIAAASVTSGHAIYVPTGGMIPKGATTMVMIEDVDLVEADQLKVYVAPGPGEHTILAGADMKQGDIVIEANKRLTATDIGALCAIGMSEVTVYKPLTFIVLSTGDELLEIDQPQSLGQIYDINSHLLCHLIEERQDEVLYRKIVRDDYDTLRNEIIKANALADVVLICGGSSVGVRDYTQDIIRSFDDGEIFIHGAAVKPGKPTIVGKANGKVIFGLPGHPVSSVMSFKLFVEHWMDTALKQIRNYDFRGQLTKPIRRMKGKTAFVMVDVDYKDDVVEITPNEGLSSMITWLSKSRGFLIVPPEGEDLQAGESVSGYKIN